MVKHSVKLMLFAVTILSACNTDKADEKKLISEIVDEHEKVMDADGKAIDNKMVLDSLLKNKIITADTVSARKISSGLQTADEQMSRWMDKFNMEYKGSHEQVMQYFREQKKQVNNIDSQLNSLNAQAEKLILPYKKR